MAAGSQPYVLRRSTQFHVSLVKMATSNLIWAFSMALRQRHIGLSVVGYAGKSEEWVALRTLKLWQLGQARRLQKLPTWDSLAMLMVLADGVTPRYMPNWLLCIFFPNDMLTGSHIRISLCFTLALHCHLEIPITELSICKWSGSLKAKVTGSLQQWKITYPLPTNH